MSKHLERVLGGAPDDEPVADEELGMNTYLGTNEPDDLDAPSDNPVQDDPPMFASNTEIDAPLENPLDFSSPEDTENTEMLVTPGQDEGPPTDFPKGRNNEEPTDNARAALTEQFLERAYRRMINSQKFQQRSMLLGEGSEEDEDAGL
jgi:hypothetical protein